MVSALRMGLAAGALVAAATAASAAAPVARAGEWETVVNNTRSIHVCLDKDRTFDAAGLTRALPTTGGKCTLGEVRTAGAVTTFAMSCEVGGGHMTTHNTLTVASDQAYTMHVTAHLEGGPPGVHDMDITQVAHRTGECQPRDRTAKAP